MLIIGLTGGIGSGKTAASDYFESKGITVVDADLVSRLVVEPGQIALEKISEHFGKEILTTEGFLDRTALRKIVFEAPEQRLWLEGLLNPLIAAEIQKQLKASQSPYTSLVSPILFESGHNLYTQRTLVIDAPEELQISRTSERDHTDANGVKAIMKAQTQREVRTQKADDSVINDGSLEDLYKKIDNLHETYLALAKTD